MKSDRIKKWPARERPRERLIAEGPERLTDAELLAIVLRVGARDLQGRRVRSERHGTRETAWADFRGWRGLDRAFTQDLMKVPGLSKAKVAQIKATLEIGKRLHTQRLTSISFELPVRLLRTSGRAS